MVELKQLIPDGGDVVETEVFLNSSGQLLEEADLHKVGDAGKLKQVWFSLLLGHIPPESTTITSL